MLNVNAWLNASTSKYVLEICRSLFRYKRMSSDGKYAEIETELARPPQGKH